MRTVHVVLRVGKSPRTSRLFPGALIGRGVAAELEINAPEISEAHAMISLRGGALCLLALRGPVRSGGRYYSELPLQPGMAIDLSEAHTLYIDHVELPDEVMGVRIAAQAPIPLQRSMYTLVGPEHPALLLGLEPKGLLATLWSADGGWWIREDGSEGEPMEDGQEWCFDGVTLRACMLPRKTLSKKPTTSKLGRYHPLTIRLRYETVHIHSELTPSVVLNGNAARLFCELYLCGCPVKWETVAGELWKDGVVPRHRWDRVLDVLRGKLREVGIRDDLIRASGRGDYELFLVPSDRVIDDM